MTLRIKSIFYVLKNNGEVISQFTNEKEANEYVRNNGKEKTIKKSKKKN